MITNCNTARAFGNDLSNRGKTPGDARKTKGNAVFEKRITRSMSKSSAAMNLRHQQKSRSNATNNRRIDPAVPSESLANLPIPTCTDRNTLDNVESTLANFARVGATSGSTGSFAIQSTHMSRNVSKYQYNSKPDDIDAPDQDDELAVTAYVEEIYSYHRENETAMSVKPTYMIHQPAINERMRGILIDWLGEVHHKLRHNTETLYLTVHIIDRFLKARLVERSQLQLVGITSFFIAAKYEEIYYPEPSELAHICDSAYSTNDILRTEEEILKTLEYRITVPTANVFLSRFLKAAHSNSQMASVAAMLLESTLLNYQLLHYLPSQLACGAVLIARKVEGRNLWSPTLVKYTGGYSEKTVTIIARDMLLSWAEILDKNVLQSVRRKYSLRRFNEASKISLPAPGDL